MNCCDLYSGKLRTPIEIQEYKATSDGMGGVTQKWTTVLNTRAFFKHASGYERLQAMKLNSGVIHKVYMRFSETPTAAHRVLYKGQAYQIRYVIDIEERHQWLELQVEENVPT